MRRGTHDPFSPVYTGVLMDSNNLAFLNTLANTERGLQKDTIQAAHGSTSYIEGPTDVGGRRRTNRRGKGRRGAPVEVDYASRCPKNKKSDHQKRD